MSYLDINNITFTNHLYNAIPTIVHCVYGEKLLRRKTNKIIHIVLKNFSCPTLKLTNWCVLSAGLRLRQREHGKMMENEQTLSIMLSSAENWLNNSF